MMYSRGLEGAAAIGDSGQGIESETSARRLNPWLRSIDAAVREE